MTPAAQLSRVFEGRTVWIVAGGPSLKGFDFEQLRGRETIAINRAFEVVPHARMLWWSDAKFWRANSDALIAHPAAIKATLQLLYADNEISTPEVWCFHASGMEGYDERPGFLRHGNNSTFAAMHAAAGLGAARLILLGVDMKNGSKGETHFHSGYGRVANPTTFERVMLPQFRSLVKPLAKLGVEVVNASPESLLTHWPRMTQQEAFERYGAEP